MRFSLTRFGALGSLKRRAALPSLSLPAHVNLVFYGNSWIEYYGDLSANTDATRISAFALAALPVGPTYTRVNLGYSGQLAEQLDTDFANRVPAAFDPAATMNILAPEAGINDQGSGRDPIATYKRRRSIARKAIALGFKVVDVTIGSRGDGAAFDSNTYPLTVLDRQLYSTDMGALALADIAARPEFGTAAAASNLTYYRADKLHPSTKGNEVIGKLVIAPAIASIITGAAKRVLGTTYSPVDRSWSLTLSADNRTVSRPANTQDNASIKGLPEMQTGKWYWELVRDNTGGNIQLGICNRAYEDSIVYNNTTLYNDPNAMFVLQGVAVYQGAQIGPDNPQAVVNGSVEQYCLDADARLIWSRIDGGSWNSDPTADPATGKGGRSVAVLGTGPLYPAVTLIQAPAQITSRFARAEQTGVLPFGFGTFA